MTTRDENGAQYVSLKWCIGILMALLLSGVGAWANQRHAVENALASRLSAVEWNQSRVLATLELNRETLGKIYDELKLHRQTGN
jgi:hypothetical protein